jgi:hypothetical protein
MHTRVSSVAAAGVLAVLTMVAPRPAWAQEGLQEFGMKAGVNFSTLKFGDPEVVEGDEPNRRAGFTAGIYLARRVHRALAFQGEALVWVKGAEFDSEKLRLTYLEVPLLARINLRQPIDHPVHLLTGPALAFKLDASATFDGVSVDVGGDFENFDVGWVLGGGVDFDSFVIDARYVWGLLNAPRGVPVNAPKIRNESFAIMVGLTLGRR